MRRTPAPGTPRMSSVAPNLAEVVMQRVTKRTGRRVVDLAIEVRGKQIILRGRTASYHVKQLAQQGAREAVPHAELENAIVVEV